MAKVLEVDPDFDHDMLQTLLDANPLIRDYVCEQENKEGLQPQRFQHLGFLLPNTGVENIFTKPFKKLGAGKGQRKGEQSGRIVPNRYAVFESLSEEEKAIEEESKEVEEEEDKKEEMENIIIIEAGREEDIVTKEVV